MLVQNVKSIRVSGWLSGAVLLAGALAPAAPAAVLCVRSQGGGMGCYAKIGDAVAAAAAGDVVRISAGTYHEDVVIGKPLSLIGENGHAVIVDATGLANGIEIDGHGHPGLSKVSVSGLTVRNANFQGILVTNATQVSITGNQVTGNDRSLQPFAQGGPVCPGLPAYFQAGEGFDCGEGIHLTGVSYSSVVNNVVEHNAGGILLSDDLGGTHDNLLASNQVSDNVYDCGITLASHHFAMALDAAYGVHHNAITGNRSTGNGTATGEGAGVGLFAAPPGGQTYANAVIGNSISGNALPGVAMHSHSPVQKLNDNLISGNDISANGPDGDPGTTVPTGISVFADEAGGAPPITGTTIFGNSFSRQSIGIAVATTGGVEIHFNRFANGIGVDNLSTGKVNATLNWWGCANGPGAPGCATVSGTGVTFTPWLTHPF